VLACCLAGRAPDELDDPGGMEQREGKEQGARDAHASCIACDFPTALPRAPITSSRLSRYYLRHKLGPADAFDRA
jgi:hypothetical protein